MGLHLKPPLMKEGIIGRCLLCCLCNIARFAQRTEALPVWSKISNALKRLGFRSHNFLAQLLSETSRACTIRVRRSTLERLWNELGSHAGLHHRHCRSRTAVAERIFGCGEPYPESPDQGPTASFGS